MTTTDLPGGAAAVLAECRRLIDGFDAAGRRLYLVGGLVRDLYRGGSLDELDLDFTTDAHPAQVKAILGPIADALWTQGERFGTIAALVGGRLVEITTHRAEAYDPESRKPAVVFADDVLIDLSRRDFTINALAIELTAARPRLIDPYDGVGALRARRLRTPLAPSESFSDDPLRMMRAARFAARLGVVPDPDIVDAMSSMVDRLSVVSVERVRDELDKILATADPTAGLELLLRTGLAPVVLPELDDGSIRRVAAAAADPVVRMASILVDVGEPGARARARALRHSRTTVDRIGSIVGVVDALRDHDERWTDAEVRRLAFRARDDLDASIDVLEVTGRVNGAAAALRGRVAAVGAGEDLGDLRPAIDGKVVMDELGLRPGRDVGVAVQYLTDLRLEDGPMSPEAALERLREWWAARAG